MNARPATLLFLAACGLSAGRLPLGSIAVEPPRGVTVEPGLSAALRGEVERALLRGGVDHRGPPLSIEIREVVHDPVGAAEGGSAEVWRARLLVRAEIRSRPACVVEVSGSDSWSVGPGPESMVHRRADALERLSQRIAARLVDALAAEPSCRPPR
ncbi:MAG: hypothetical protein EA397_14710 [Deltaproteobacteria bacterium]|nr:MAG: hypothetical protein EA397_14710 [Deltaproteobacteria bacterium]